MDTKELKNHVRNPYAWPGGYEKIFVCSDGGTLCAQCVRENFREVLEEVKDTDPHAATGWRVDGVFLDCDTDSEVTCDHCGRVIVEEWKDD